MAVVELVSRADGTDPLELEPLYNAIDPEHLDSLCDPDSGFSSLEFVYAGRTVVVESTGGELEIALQDANGRPSDVVRLTDVASST
ncbi:HalOD1 output domain-containing protein [Natrialbaceae archaeon A-arb3/5]